MTYRMETTHSCGPDALSFAINKDRKDVYALMEWPNKCDWRDNARDYIGSHFKVLDHYKIPHKLVDLSFISWGYYPKNSIVCLLHNYPERESSLMNAIFYQHWVVIERVEGDNIFIHDGSGFIKQYRLADFKHWYYDGAPNCAYIVDEGELGGFIYEKFWDSLMNFFIKSYNFITRS